MKRPLLLLPFLASVALAWWAFQGNIRVSIADGRLQITRADWSWETPRELANLPTSSIRFVEYRSNAYIHHGGGRRSVGVHLEDGVFLHVSSGAKTPGPPPVLKYTHRDAPLSNGLQVVEIPVPGSHDAKRQMNWKTEPFCDRLLTGIKTGTFEDGWRTHSTEGFIYSISLFVLGVLLLVRHFVKSREKLH